jgi:hypothetical protein
VWIIALSGGPSVVETMFCPEPEPSHISEKLRHGVKFLARYDKHHLKEGRGGKEGEIGCIVTGTAKMRSVSGQYGKGRERGGFYRIWIDTIRHTR